MKDVQNGKSEIDLDIEFVGVTNVQFPIVLLDKNERKQQTVAEISMFVNLPGDQKGTHMSRFIEILNEHAEKVFDLKHTPLILRSMKERFDCEQAKIDLTAPYFIKKIAPVSKKESLLKIDIRFTFTLNNHNERKIIGMTIPVTSLCPCSKEISKYGAHNQRSYVTLQVRCKEFVWIEDFVELVEKNASSPVYPLLKRPDEKHVTEQAYENPVFVEDLVRRIAQDIIASGKVLWFRVAVESQESIHDHNAYALFEWGDDGE